MSQQPQILTTVLTHAVVYKNIILPSWQKRKKKRRKKLKISYSKFRKQSCVFLSLPILRTYVHIFIYLMPCNPSKIRSIASLQTITHNTFLSVHFSAQRAQKCYQARIANRGNI